MVAFLRPRCEEGAVDQAFEGEPRLEGAPGLDAHRAEIVARAQGEPVLFVRAPRAAPDDDAVVRALRKKLETTRFPWDYVRHLVPRFRARPELGRRVLLREGYLYAEKPDVAFSIYDTIDLRDLFREDELWIERGARTHRVVKADRGPNVGRYVYADGDAAGDLAHLYLFDRAGPSSDPPGRPLHRDVRSLAHDLGFDRLRLVRATERHLLVELRYEDRWVTSLLGTEGPRVTLECERLESESARLEVAGARARIARHGRALAALRREMVGQVVEELPFDEPRTEWGQQDGWLRYEWEKAYLRGDETYRFNFDTYPVFTKSGTANVPQVCIDFITQTLERATGTWYASKGEKPRRRVGKLDFDPLITGSRRQVDPFLHLARSTPEQFEVWTLPYRERIQFQYKARFFDYLEEHRDEFRPGDVVVIRGYAPWDHNSVPHYHTFFVYESDPVTGMPILLAGNAGKPRIQSWEAVMARTPLRSIHHRVRPRLGWLASLVEGEADDAGPPKIVVNVR